MSDGESYTREKITKSKKYLFGILFLFGFSVMSWIPRFPEVKKNMGVPNGEFGTIISVGALGGIFMLLIGGHIVHRFGTLIVLQISSIGFVLATAAIINVKSVPLFILCNLLNGASVSAFHIAANAQVLYEQETTGEILMPRTAGAWSTGALATIVLSGILTSHVSLTWHIVTLMFVSLAIMTILLRKIAPFALKGSDAPDEDFTLKNILRNFDINWPVSIGLLLGVQMEFTAGDWATIYAKENLSFSAGLATLPYIIFISAMISGRLTIHKIARRYPMEALVKIAGLTGGSVFIIGITLSNLTKENSPHLAFTFACIGFLVGGFGSSFMGPLFMNTANRQSDSPGGVVIGQLGVINNSLTFLVKGVIAWTAQWLSLPIALIIPGLMLMGVAAFAKVSVADQR